jgi:threonyl-tRNA synthetase
MSNETPIEPIRHSLSHLMSMAITELYPTAGLGVGPVIENGFYQDYDLPETINQDLFLKLEKRMREMIAEEIEFKQHNVEFDEALKAYKNDPYKTELIEGLRTKGEKNVSFYLSGSFDNLCGGPHVKNTKEINPDAFKLIKVAGAYWRGDEKNKMLTRIYGVAFATKEELEAYITMLVEAEKRDHKKLGRELDLFVFSDLVGSGLPLWTPNGMMLRTLLDNFVWELRDARGYEKVEIPHITKKELYEVSGHWDKFKDELFRITTREGHEFAMKPMNCPHHTQIYARKAWSYRELPQRYANSTMCYRDEQSGELSGLSRARSFTQDDAHVFCRPTQAKEEFLKIWDIVHEFYGVFGFNLKVRLSIHDPKQPEKYLGDAKRWEYAETVLREIVTEKNVDWFEGLGEAAFYGPKLDFMAQDSLGRQWQVATIQLDLNMPERFNLFCHNEEGKEERIVMIHAAIMGSIERFLSILIEHMAGHFPLWLAPVQVSVLPIGEAQLDYAKQVAVELKKVGIRAQVDERNEKIGKKIRDNEIKKIPVIAVVGDREMQAKTIALRMHGKKDGGVLTIDQTIELLKKAIDEKKISFE